LQKHKSEGPIYWYTKPVSTLLHTPFEDKIANPQLLPFPKYQLTELVALADATYATDLKTWCSISGGYAIVYGGAAIGYKAKVQPTIMTSLTEAKFIAAIYVAKAIKQFYFIVQLGFPTSRPYDYL